MIQPEFFDIFGIAVFAYIISIAIRGFLKKEAISKIDLISLLIIGILGFIIDSINVYSSYLK